MFNNYILIDFENIQPDNLEIIKNFNFKIIIFVGSNQKKISFEMVDIIQSFGNKAEYIKIEGTGQNALDFHIAFYIGKISALEKEAFFHIISKDTGFDPLINHLKLKKLKVQRVKDIAEIPMIKNLLNKVIPEAPTSITKISAPKISENKVTPIKKEISKIPNNDEKIEKIINSLKQRPRKPTTKKALTNTIIDIFQKKLNKKEIENLLNEILKREYISINDTKVNYSLPKK